MRLQFNLLPDVKLEYLKTQRTKRTIILASCLVSAFALFIFMFMIATVYLVNKNQLSDADKDVQKYSRQLKDIPNLDKILTIQNQLKSLSGLHQNKHKVSKLYEYLPQVTPVNIKIGQMNIDFVANVMTINGTTDTQRTINTFIDTLKFTTIAVDGKDTKSKAFPSVIESQFGLTKDGAGYGLTVKFDPQLFSNAQNVTLIVPGNFATTRSILDNPIKDLFDGATLKDNKDGAGGGQ